jgi:predicted lipoprotein
MNAVMPRQRRLITWSAVAASLAIALYFFPLFHIVPLNQTEQRAADAAFDPVAFVDRFWTERLIPGATRAVDAGELVAAVARDRQSARRTHGRSVGLGGVYYYFVAGTGRVVSIEKDSVGLSLRDDQPEVHVSLATGNIFGNVVRDGTGLLDVNDFANSQDFNALSSELNRRIEKQVLPALRKRAAVGVQVQFVGCTEIIDEETDLLPLRVVPFVAELP